MNEPNLAHEVAIEQMEWGEWEGDSHGDYPEWLDEYVYSASRDEFGDYPALDDQVEAAAMFGELQDDLDVAEFEAWIDDLTSIRYFQVRSAIEVIRSALADYQGDLDMSRLLKAIHPA